MSFSKTVSLPVAPEEAFALLTEPERLRRWKTVSASVDLRAGGAYRFTVVPGHVAAGTYREVEPGKRIVFGWGWEGSSDLPPDTSTVIVTIEASADGGSTVTLVHDGLTAEQAASHGEGWNHYFDRLETLAAKGEVGQDDWAWAPQEFDPVIGAETVLSSVQPILRGLTTEDRVLPTPCAEYNCHELIEHLMTSLAQLGQFTGTNVQGPESGSLENKISVMTAQVIDGWRGRGFEGEVGQPGKGMPASIAASILPLEMALHGWDLAQATGQEFRISDETVAYLRTVADTLVPGGRANDSFAAEVQPDPSAGPMDRLAAFAGRTPLI